MTILYGIKNCDTVKKARHWLEQHHVAYQFHDLRTDGIARHDVEQWLLALGADKLVNKRSTTWKQLSEQDKQLACATDAVDIILANPTLIKRPLLHVNQKLYSGFTEADYTRIFA